MLDTGYLYSGTVILLIERGHVLPDLGKVLEGLHIAYHAERKTMNLQ